MDTKRRWYRQLYFYVLVAIVLGIAVGAIWPDLGAALEPIGTSFVDLMKMLIGPVVFLTIVGGIASVADLKKVGLTGLKALTYFQIGTIVALATGLVAINLFRLGDGVNVDPATLQASDDVTELVEAGEESHWWDFLLKVLPDNILGPFVEGQILQIIFIAVIFGVALNAVGRAGAPILDGVHRLTTIVFKILSYVMKLAPVGAFGAMAYAIGKYGLSTLTSLGSLIALFYVTSALFVIVGLGAVMLYLRLNIFQLLRYLREELMLVLGTSTAEPALPGLMRKMEFAGVQKSTVGLVVPTGYSFNLDGAAIYLSLAALYIAQATNTDLSIGEQLGLLAVMLLTSKGAAGVAGGGFIALTATLATVGTVPAAGIMLIFGIDKFMSECRALVNFCGNAVATLFIARWDNTLDHARARAVLRGEIVPHPADSQSADSQPADSQSADSQSADSQPADSQPADSQPAAEQRVTAGV
ncbi:C4-dicarboxylate transporter DctA [Actinoplanes sp. NBC_00393]|uniref:C4-dicarboxylate transporter DctA n=1 Tax=Actinoplanes sp. NBC_00393 TaxID=2975953 RepID=UPI002E1C9476